MGMKHGEEYRKMLLHKMYIKSTTVYIPG